VGYNKRGFFPLWDTTEEFFQLWDTTEKVFLHCGIQQQRIFSIVGYNGEQFQDGKQIFSFVSHDAGNFSSVYSTPQQNLMQCTVSQKILQHCIPQRRGFLPLYPTMEDIFLCCGIQQKWYFSLWDTTEEAFLHCGIQRKSFFIFVGYNGRGFFPLWDTMGKNDTTKNDILKFLSASNCLQIKI
jgi:hypothetical protein